MRSQAQPQEKKPTQIQMRPCNQKTWGQTFCWQRMESLRRMQASMGTRILMLNCKNLVGHLTTLEDNVLLTLSPHITPEAASMRHSPAVNTTISEIPEPDCCVDLELLHDTPLPTTSKRARAQRLPVINTGMLAIPDPEGSTNLVLPPPPRPPDKAAEPNADQLPKYIQAPTDTRGQSEPLWSEESHHAMDQMSLSTERAYEGKTPVRGAWPAS